MKDVIKEDGQEVEKQIESGLLRFCKGCNLEFLENTFFKHVSHSKNCLSAYEDDELATLKKEKRNQDVKFHHKKRSITKANLTKKKISNDDTDSQSSDDDKEMEKQSSKEGDTSYIRKRKKIDFTMADLEALAEDDMDDEYTPTD